MEDKIPARPVAVLNADVALVTNPPRADYDADRERVVVSISPDVTLDLDPGAARALVDSLAGAVDASEGHWTPDPGPVVAALDDARSDDYARGRRDGIAYAMQQQEAGVDPELWDRS